MFHFLNNILTQPANNADGQCDVTTLPLSPKEIRFAKQAAFVEACSLSCFSFAVKLLTDPTGGVRIGINDVVDLQNGNTALLRACDRWEIEQIIFLLGIGASPDARNYRGETALIKSCTYVSDYKITHLLVKKGAASVNLVVPANDGEQIADCALLRAFSSDQWTRNMEIDYSNALHTFFYVRTLKLLIKSGAFLIKDPFDEPFSALPLISRFYSISNRKQRENDHLNKRFQMSKKELHSVVRPILIKLLIAARGRSSFNAQKLRQALKSRSCCFRDEVDISEFTNAVQRQFPLRLKDLSRFAVLKQLPAEYPKRMHAINHDLSAFVQGELRDYLKFKDFTQHMKLLELKAIRGIAI